ncbi:hypothetical protein H257_15742 [Aphanomyces astaci]|uniref:Uncharacterized protein n=1 Tax=Aphanomyces astaci TaxID=112090 RepID=W4FL96_APHAT|nr:hypothetical protein H257_15742 [Aphanomyces astaci]ETV68297.1 hypothetical protein H257_15742 [Aphanomyces astaci]|eukprot:XP_009842241.1 hypothetical protein H257_15742 [Aphanomyces astaci]
MVEDSTDALEQEWAASVVQRTWRQYTERQWSNWRTQSAAQENTSSNDDIPPWTSSDELVQALGANSSDNGEENEVVLDDATRNCPNSGPSSSVEFDIGVMESQPANDIMTPPCTGSSFTKVSSVDIPKRGDSSVIAIPAAGLGVVEARLEADESYQTLKAKESVLDLQVHILVQQQQALVAQQRKLRVLKSQQERDAKARKKMANLRAKQCQELEARRQEETDKFRALETMAIIKNVDNHPQPIPKPHKKRIQPPAAPTPSLHQHTDVPIPKMKTYPRLPGLQGSSHEDFDADTKPKAIADKTSSLSSERKAVACYAQDLTPLVTGNKPRRLKVTGPRNHQPHNERTRTNKAKGKIPHPSKIKGVMSSSTNERIGNQFDDLDTPPPITIPPFYTHTISSKAPPTKYMMMSTPLTAEIKHIPWASTYSKELETPLSTMQQDFTLQCILKQHSTTPSSGLSGLTATPVMTGAETSSSPSVSLKTTSASAAVPSMTGCSDGKLGLVPTLSIQSNGGGPTVSRRVYLLNKYGKTDADGVAFPTPAIVPNSQPLHTSNNSNPPADPNWQYSSDRLQSILAKYKIATTSSTTAEPKQSRATELLLAKYAPTAT